jgi:hypothetical protein
MQNDRYMLNDMIINVIREYWIVKEQNDDKLYNNYDNISHVNVHSPFKLYNIPTSEVFSNSFPGSSN